LLGEKTTDFICKQSTITAETGSITSSTTSQLTKRPVETVTSAPTSSVTTEGDRGNEILPSNTSTVYQATSDGDNRWKTTTIASVVASAVAVSLCLAAGVFFLIQRRRKRTIQRGDDGLAQPESGEVPRWAYLENYWTRAKQKRDEKSPQRHHPVELGTEDEEVRRLEEPCNTTRASAFTGTSHTGTTLMDTESPVQGHCPVELPRVSEV